MIPDSLSLPSSTFSFTQTSHKHSLSLFHSRIYFLADDQLDIILLMNRNSVNSHWDDDDLVMIIIEKEEKKESKKEKDLREVKQQEAKKNF